jgi:pimeloyl-ACP methyl ester carboxylesterase
MADVRPDDGPIGRIHVETSGPVRGLGLVLLHANPLDGSMWWNQVAHLSAWFRTYVPDLPGYGDSDPLTGPITMPQLADAVWRAVDAAGAGHVVIGGVSIGGGLAFHMARRQPSRSLALVVSGVGFGPSKPFATRRIAGYRRDGRAYREVHLRDGHGPGFLESPAGRFAAEVAHAREGRMDVPSVVRLFEAHGAPDPDDLHSPACPVLIISGSADYVHPRSLALHEHIAGSELVVLDGAGHACNVEQPLAWDTALLDFVRRRVRA